MSVTSAVKSLEHNLKSLSVAMWLAWRSGCPYARPIFFTDSAPPLAPHAALGMLIQWFASEAGEIINPGEDIPSDVVDQVDWLALWVDRSRMAGFIVADSVWSADYNELLRKLCGFFNSYPIKVDDSQGRS